MSFLPIKTGSNEQAYSKNICVSKSNDESKYLTFIIMKTYKNRMHSHFFTPTIQSLIKQVTSKNYLK